MRKPLGVNPLPCGPSSGDAYNTLHPCNAKPWFTFTTEHSHCNQKAVFNSTVANGLSLMHSG